MTESNNNNKRSSFRSSNGIITLDEAAWLSSTTEPHPAPGWQNPTLTPLGLYFPLGPSQTRFHRSELQSVLDTLSQVFKSQSLDVTYHNTPIAATCTSMDQVEFVVSLFSKDDENEVVLEVQRRSGDAIAFQRYAQAILEATKAGRAAAPSARKRRKLTAPPSGRLLKRSKSTAENSSSESNVASALELAWAMLSTERFDAQNLGLQSLIHITNPQASGSAAKEAAMALLAPAGHIPERLAKCLLELLDRANNDARTSLAAETESSYLALIVVSQIASLAAQEPSASSLQSFLQQSPTDLVANMLDKVRNASRQPHEAVYALNFLTAVCQCGGELRQGLLKENNRDLVEAKSFGDSCHLALAKASHNLMLALQA